MSKRVDIERIKQFKKDRKRLPYNDIVVAGRMKVDRSNYSKAVKDGPITYAFLQKFYGAFGEELRQMQEVDMPVDMRETEKMIEESERRLEQRLEQLEKNLASLTDAYLAKIEALVSQIVQRSEGSQDGGDGL